MQKATLQLHTIKHASHLDKAVMTSITT